jgi:hypothetical protein
MAVNASERVLDDDMDDIFVIRLLHIKQWLKMLNNEEEKRDELSSDNKLAVFG